MSRGRGGDPTFSAPDSGRKKSGFETEAGQRIVFLGKTLNCTVQCIRIGGRPKKMLRKTLPSMRG